MSSVLSPPQRTCAEAKPTAPPATPPRVRTGAVFRREVAIAEGRAGDPAAVGANAALVELQRAERARAEEHTAGLQAHLNLLCRPLLANTN